MEKRKIFLTVLVGLMMTAAIIGCDLFAGECVGNGECTVTIEQGDGLFVDTSKPRSSCGSFTQTKTRYNQSTGAYDPYEEKGCKVEDNIRGYQRRYGTHSCNCTD